MRRRRDPGPAGVSGEVTGEGMAVRAVGRQADEQAVAAFLDGVPSAPAALVIEGDPGIGKTTLWHDALDQARGRGFTVLASRAARAESVLAYAALADLLADVHESLWADLPAPQQRSLDAALLRCREHAGLTDARAVAAAFVAVLDRLATRSESFVLLAIDDLQWIDISSANVVSFAARRLPPGVGLMCTTRSAKVAGQVELAHPHAVHRIRLQPLTVGELHRVLTLRLNGSVPRPTLLRIHQIAGGNPFFALELARAIDSGSGELRLSGSLNELVSSRLKRVGPDAQELLLAMASVPHPTLRILAESTGRSTESVLEALGEAEAQAVVAIDGNRVSFTHPVLAHGVYTDAAPRERRAMHRRLAQPSMPSTERPRLLNHAARRRPRPNCWSWQSIWVPTTQRVESCAQRTTSPPATPGAHASCSKPSLTASQPARFAPRPSISSLWSGYTRTGSSMRQSFWKTGCRGAAPTTHCESGC